MFPFLRPNPTVAHLLEKAIVPSQRLGHSDVHAVYPLGHAGSELGEFVVRIARDASPASFRSRLMRSSSLQSPEQVAAGMAIGQPLLESRGSTMAFSIHRREHGMPIKAMVEQRANRYAEAAMDAMQPLLHRAGGGENPFQEAIDTSYRLLRAGRKPDLHEGNVLVETGARRLALVDQIERHQPPLGHEEAVTALTGCGDWLYQTITQSAKQAVQQHPAPAEYESSCARVRDLITKAVRAVAAREAPGAYRGPAFRQVKRHEVALAARPHALTQALRSLSNEAGLPR